MIWALAQGAAAGGGAILNWLNARKNRTPEFHRTQTGQFLAKMSREGAYGTDMRRKVVEATSKAASNSAQMGKSSMLGYLEARGMRDSVAAQSGLNEQDMNVQRAVGDAADRIEVENERTKSDAAMRYAQGADAASEARRSETKAANAGLIGGLVNAGAQTYANVMQEKRMARDDKRVDAMNEYYLARAKAQDKGTPDANLEDLLLIGDPLKRSQWAKERGLDPDVVEEQYWAETGRRRRSLDNAITDRPQGGFEVYAY